jgi:hypothetical protein
MPCLFNDQLADQVILRLGNSLIDQVSDVVKKFSISKIAISSGELNAAWIRLKVYLLALEASVAVALPLLRMAAH